jgi:putative PEP-CTERM system histidine kinase
VRGDFGVSSVQQIITDWGHMTAAALAVALALWCSRRYGNGVFGKLFVASLCLTGTWALAVAIFGHDKAETGLLESIRNCAWVTCLFAMPWSSKERKVPRPRAFGLIYALLIAILCALCVVDLLASVTLAGSAQAQATGEAGKLLRMVWTISAVLMVNRLFFSIAAHNRTRATPMLAGLTALWTFDLLAYCVEYFNAALAVDLFVARGLVTACLLPFIALSTRQSGSVEIQPSYTLALRSAVYVSVFVTIAAILAAIAFVDQIAFLPLRLMATGGIFVIIVAALVVLPSDHFRATLKVYVVKHLLKHRYDYRTQWMGFADTIGRAIGSEASLYERAIKAMADITESPAGVLLLVEDNDRMVVQSQWNWHDGSVLGAEVSGELIHLLMNMHWVVDIDQLRETEGSLTPALPEWIAADHRTWALIPVIHFDQLTGAVLLARPRFSHKLDWEDFDMLRTAGRQVASYIAESQGQQALAESRRFDEFNRRFAFIMHDIKNLVSQLSLLSRNAQRHADNPDFRADMILTLQDSVGKMNDLLARLSQHNRAAPPAKHDFALASVAKAVSQGKVRTHPVLLEGDMSVRVCADAAHVETILQHLVQNAIEASAPESPVVLRLGMADGMAAISVVDKGCGMNAAFVRNDLFRPFASSKSGGFGIGAFEARELAQAMSGSLRVESQPGEGSCFTLFLPLVHHTEGDLPAGIIEHQDIANQKDQAA